MDAISLSPWTNTPPTSGSLQLMYSGISFCGVMLFLAVRVIDKRRWSEG